VGGELTSAFLPLSAAARLLREGKLRALAVTSRSTAVPDAPTFSQLGVQGMDDSWYGVSAPRAMEPRITAALSNDFQWAATIEKTKITQIGVEAEAGDARQLAELTTREGTRWTRIAKAARLGE
jgi:tripartite-type tricarboxylate transporter receptor subunit TctC